MTEPVRILFLGGLGEIGRNCAIIQQNGRSVMLDCGLMFPDADLMPGVDLVLPDFTWIRENASQIEGLVLTHAHEDHVGAMSFLLREVEFPNLTVYGSALTIGMARHRVDEAGLGSTCTWQIVDDNASLAIGPFVVDFIPVTHTVPHGFATAWHTDHGVILHSGDFKIDLTPIDGRRTDLAALGHLAATDGVRVLLCDSTNAEEPGFTPSEASVGDSLRKLFPQYDGKRIITACFASNLHRVQQIVDAARASGRTVATLGRSMGKNVALGREMGLLDIPDHALVDIEELSRIPDAQVCIVSTGSQGEPMSALALMASGESKWAKITDNDVVILSSNAIPGNEGSVNRTIDGLMRRGAEVLHAGLAHVHASGHAKQGELALLHNLTRPEWFVPVHGEYRHLKHHALLAETSGIDPDKIVLALDGDVLRLDETGLHVEKERIPAGYLYVDGTVGDVAGPVLRDRRVLAEEGVVVVVVTIDMQSGKVIAGPEIITRGWVHAAEAEELLDDAAAEVLGVLEDALRSGPVEFEQLQRRARRALGAFVNERTRRRPMIVPVIMEI